MKKHVCIITIILSLLVTNLSILNSGEESDRKKTIYVDDNGGLFRKIKKETF